MFMYSSSGGHNFTIYLTLRSNGLSKEELLCKRETDVQKLNRRISGLYA